MNLEIGPSARKCVQKARGALLSGRNEALTVTVAQEIKKLSEGARDHSPWTIICYCSWGVGRNERWDERIGECSQGVL